MSPAEARQRNVEAGELIIGAVAHWYHVPWADLESVWPWGKVKRQWRNIKHLEFRQHLPAAQALTAFINANRGKDSKAITDPTTVMWPDYLPDGMRTKESAAPVLNKWTPGIVASFELLMRRGYASNALMFALGVNDLRKAGGWKH